MKKVLLLVLVIQMMAAQNRLEAQRAPAAGELVITEIMANPEKVADAKGEWFELLNRSSDTLLLNGIVVSDLGSDRHVLQSEQPILLAPGALFVMVRDGDPLVNGGIQGDYVIRSFSLGNSEDEVILQSEEGILIDQVVYGNGWPLAAGVSMELAYNSADAALNDLPANWHKAVAPYGDGDLGTPGLFGNPASGYPLVPGELQITLHPNPCHLDCTLEVIFATPQSGSVMVSNLVGQRVLLEWFHDETRLSRRLSPGTWVKGVYFVELRTRGERAVKRLLVL